MNEVLVASEYDDFTQLFHPQNVILSHVVESEFTNLSSKKMRGKEE